jgi:hypothetical protein
MKWFKHDTNALHDAKIEKLIMKYGIEGYGVYFACIELIAHDVSEKNITFELEHDAEILAYKFKVDTVKLEEIMLYCIHLGLFGQSEVNGRLTCLKLAERIDQSQVKNPQIKNIKEQLSGVFSEKPCQIRLDKIRLEENIVDKNRFIKPTIDDVTKYIKEKGYNVNAEKFISYYESVGWKVGSKSMKDWKAAVRTWNTNQKEYDKQKPAVKEPKYEKICRHGRVCRCKAYIITGENYD